jgi:hypothetical protein
MVIIVVMRLNMPYGVHLMYLDGLSTLKFSLCRKNLLILSESSVYCNLVMLALMKKRRKQLLLSSLEILVNTTCLEKKVQG